MNPWYLVAALLGLYGVTRLSVSSTAAAKNAASAGKVPVKFKFAGAPGGTPVQQLAASIANAKAIMDGWAAATADAWIDTNMPAIGSVKNDILHWYTLLHNMSTPYAKIHPEMNGYYPLLRSYATQLQSLAFKRWATNTDQDKGGVILHKSGASAGSTQLKSAKDLISKAQSIISSFPADGSETSAYVGWLATAAVQVPSIVSDVQGLTANDQNTQQDIQTALGLIPTLTQLVSKATSSSAAGSSATTTADNTTQQTQTTPDTTQLTTAPSDGTA